MNDYQESASCKKKNFPSFSERNIDLSQYEESNYSSVHSHSSYPLVFPKCPLNPILFTEVYKIDEKEKSFSWSLWKGDKASFCHTETQTNYKIQMCSELNI